MLGSRVGELHSSRGGERVATRRRLLMRDPRLVMLDEPFGQLDPGGVELMKEVFGELQERGCTILLATHQHALGRSLCDVEMSLKGGELAPAPRPIVAPVEMAG